MIPVKLGLRNFMSYTDIHQPLLFDGIHVACLCGENGAGKSALLDAVTWVLWGESRARTANDLVHTGRTEMEVELEFVLADNAYRVLRKRATSGRGSTVLELSVADNGAFRSISGNSVNETEKIIEDLLRMDYATFTNASLFLQGKADSFTTRTPAERKQVLADILELSEYDRLQERARREVQQREVAHRALESGLREADAELERRPGYQAELELLEARLGELEIQIKVRDAALGQLRERVAALSAREHELSEALERVVRTEAEVKRHVDEIAGAQGELERNRAMIAREREIEKGHAELLQTRRVEEEMNAKLADYVRLAEERNRLERHLAAERSRLEAELASVEQRSARAEGEAARLREHEQEGARARESLGQLRQLQDQQAGLERRLGSIREQVAQLRGANQRLRQEMLDLKSKIDVLQVSPICPICRSRLDEAGRAALIERYNGDGKAQKAEYQRNNEQAGRLEEEAQQLEAQLQRLVADVAQMLDVERRLAAAEQAAHNARRAAQEADGCRTEQERIRDALQRGSLAGPELQALAGVRERLEALGYDEAIHQRIRVDLGRLSSYEGLKRELDSSRQALAYQQQIVEQVKRSLVGWQERLDLECRRVEELRRETRELPILRQQACEAETELEALRRAQGEANRELGEARQRLAYLEHLEQQRRERLRQMEDLLRVKSLYTDLAAAFGKNGIQAMIIETAIPEIEDEANRLLSGMTDSRMHVKFETQRATRGGDGTIETLDILINDELGPRPYEMYSGGESFRVNFAIRIALSKLLARRAGVRLQTLVIDEGFGSQDEDGRERLVEAIQSVADQFAMILVITHIDELKERFPVRIEVRKTALGSTLGVDWAG
ncbi:MAG TPA: SMC family ATPase [Chloroflexota bacterium]|nr:SMC family ATPase [Chloroflexota bacterium]